MKEPFWQWRMTHVTGDIVADFLGQRVPEGEHIKYKELTFGQNGKLDFRNNVLEIIVAFANTGGGIIFVGVAEGGERRPRSRCRKR